MIDSLIDNKGGGGGKSMGSSALDNFINGAGGDILGGMFSSRQSYKYGRKMRKSSYQDTVASLRSAGLNPLLAVKNGAAPTSMPSGDWSMGNRSAATAMQKRLVTAQIKKMESEGYNQRMQGNLHRINHAIGQVNHFLSNAEKELFIRRLPALRIAASTEGGATTLAKWNKYLSLLLPTGSTLGNSAKFIYGPKGLNKAK